MEEDSDDSESSLEVVNVNSISIEEISDSISLSEKEKGTPKLNFSLGL